MATVTTALQDLRYLHVGGGGFMMSHDQHDDGTLIATGDVFGLFLLSTTNPATGVWSNIFNASKAGVFNYIDSVIDTGCAPYAAKIAPSNSSIIYAIWSFYKAGSNTEVGACFRTADKGVTWTLQNSITTGELSTCTYNDIPANSHGRTSQGKLWIDPLDSNHLLLGTRDRCILRSTDAGVTWTQMTDVTAPVTTSQLPGITCIMHNPAASAVGGKSGEIYCCSYANGWFKSTDAGENWTLLTGSPTSGSDAVFSHDGLYIYASSGELAAASRKLRRYNVGADTWTDITPTSFNNGIHTLDIDPFAPARLMICSNGGGLIETQNHVTVTSGSGWSADNYLPATNTLSADDIVWAEMSMEDGYKSSSLLRFDKNIQNRLILSEGIGMWYVDLAPGFTTVPWQSFTDETDLLIATNVVPTPDSGPIYLASWDRPLWCKPYAERWTYPTEYVDETIRPSGILNILSHCFMLDYAKSDPDCVYATTIPFAGTNGKGYRTTNGGTSWSELTALNSGAYDTQSNRFMGGAIAVSTPDNAVIFSTNNNRPRYTTDGGANWSVCTFGAPFTAWDGTGSPSDSDTAAGFYGTGSSLRRIVVAADHVTANKFYAVHSKFGSWASTDSGANWTNVDPYGSDNGYLGFTSGAPRANIARLRAVPGNAGHLFFTAGKSVTAGESRPVTRSLYRTTDGAATWTAVADVRECIDVSFGPVVGSYATVWVLGWVDNGSGYALGVYYSTDECVTWTKVAAWPFFDRLDVPYMMQADPTNHKEYYIAFGNSGWAFSDGAAAGFIRGNAVCV